MIRKFLNYSLSNQYRKGFKIKDYRIIKSCSRKFSSSPDDDTKDYFVKVENIRNFSIIAHVDHGKSTLADRLLEVTGAKKKNSGKNQVLDALEVEQERGITVKANAVSLLYKHEEETYLLNLIDTPGHVDFANEVCRSLSASGGVILLVDANHGVQAQTIANYHLAVGKNLKIVPVLNKIDLKHANPEQVEQDLFSLFDILPEDVLRVSAKLGIGIDSVFEHIIKKIPPPESCRDEAFRAHLFDSWYDKYRGALNLMFIKDGEVKLGQEIVSCESKKIYIVKSLSLLTPEEKNVKKLIAGQIGLIGMNMRNSKEAVIGDTYHLKGSPTEPLEVFKKLRPMIFAGIYPSEQSQHVALRGAIEKLVLNDSVVTFAPETSPALGHGFRLGFLGLLHLEVFVQRLQQEYQAEPIITAPSVTYKIKLKNMKNILKQHGGKEIISVSNPKFLPEPNHVEEYFEPTVLGTIITPSEYIGKIISLCIEKRGIQKSSINLDENRIMMTYQLPLSEVVVDFHDHIKSLSSGFASFDFEEKEYVSTNLVKLEILLNGVPVEELSNIVHARNAETFAKDLVGRLKELIPRQMVMIAIQGVVGGKVLARETIRAYRKDVTQWLYGGDVTRRMKLLKQQSEGKKKMRSIANVNVPRDTFIRVLKRF
ncbi:CLUMA_CG009855, isoform A [Clunio marinus]|uniref:Translation factor GUF1 homolog, mitochondrial n=1 Tax=Clunio marinus TaxID=568069 RepID=A0A1J1I7Z7_9DIPT|nr:CLUMA_CG009855, isoform A [Clunio marinus]